jgi:lipid-A-disaccharide synthase
MECAIMNVPMIITYKVSLLTAILMKLFMRVRSIGLVNIVAGRKIVPELIQFDLTVGKVFKEASKVLFESQESDRIKKELAQVKKSLGEEGASRHAAVSIINSL